MQSQPFSAIRKHGDVEEEACNVLLKFDSDMWEIAAQNGAEKACIQHLLECIINGVSLEDAVAKGKEMNLIGLDRSTIKCGGLHRKAVTEKRLDECYFVLIPGKLFVFKSSDIAAKHVRYVTSLSGAGIRVLSREQEFQILARGTKTMFLVAPTQEEMNSWVAALNEAIECTKQMGKAPDLITAVKLGHKSRTNRIQWHPGDVSKEVYLSSSNVNNKLTLVPKDLPGSNTSSRSNANNKLGEGSVSDSVIISNQYEATRRSIPGRQVSASPMRSRSFTRDLQRQSKAMVCLETALDELEHIISNMRSISRQGAIHQSLTVPKLESHRKGQPSLTGREEPEKATREDSLASSRTFRAQSVVRSSAEPLNKNAEWQMVKDVQSDHIEHGNLNDLLKGGTSPVQTSREGLPASSLEMSPRVKSGRFTSLGPVPTEEQAPVRRTSSIDAPISISSAGEARSSVIQPSTILRTPSVMRQGRFSSCLDASDSFPGTVGHARSFALQPSTSPWTSSIMSQGELTGNLDAPDNVLSSAGQGGRSAVEPSTMLQTTSIMRYGELTGYLDAPDTVPASAGQARPSAAQPSMMPQTTPIKRQGEVTDSLGAPISIPASAAEARHSVIQPSMVLQSSSIMKQGELAAERLSKRFSMKPLFVEAGHGKGRVPVEEQAPVMRTNSLNALVSTPATLGQARPSAIQISMRRQPSAFIREGELTTKHLSKNFITKPESVEGGRGSNSYERDGTVGLDQQMPTVNDPIGGAIESSVEEGDEDEEEDDDEDEEDEYALTRAVTEEARHSVIDANSLSWQGGEYQNASLNSRCKESLHAAQNVPSSLKNSVVLSASALQTQKKGTSNDGFYASKVSCIPPMVGKDEYKLTNNRKTSVYSRACGDFSSDLSW